MSLYLMRIPLPVTFLCGFATGIAAWIGTKSPEASSANLNKAASTITVSLSPSHGGVTSTQPLQLTASVQNDPSDYGVNWTSSGGVLSNQTARSATFTAMSPGVYTISATSKADATSSALASVGVTDLVGVATWRNDREHSGVNSQEY